MIRKSIKIAIRRLITLKVYSIINIIGLAIAISVCIAILLYVTHHLSFDKYIPKGENSYRLITRYGDGSYATNTFACFDDVLSDFPEVESHTICFDNHHVEEVFVGENKMKVDNAIFVNESFFDFFGIKMIRGDASSINEPNTVMLTPDLAAKYFAEEDAVGQTILLRSFSRNRDSLIAYFISGIIEPLPSTSHIKYDMLLSQSGHFSQTVEAVKTRKVFGALIYIKTIASADINELEKNLQLSIEPILGGKHGPPLEAFNHKLQAVYDIHTTQGVRNESQATVRQSSLNILLLVGFLIFAIAIMNSVIIHNARTAFNTKAILIIRFHGGSKKNLFVQTFIEVFISVSISFMLAILFLEALQLPLSEHFSSDWNISLQSFKVWIILFSLFLIIVFIISLLSSLNLLKNESILKETSRSGKIHIAVPLVIFQFVMVISLIGFALLLNKQMKFIEEKELGYVSENVVVVDIPQVNEKINVLRNELMKFPDIISAGTAHHYPGYRFQDMTFTNGNNSFPFIFGFIDQDAIQTLQIKPLLYFDEFKEEASDGWIINETFYNQLRSKYTEEQIATGNFPQDESQTDMDAIAEFSILGVMSDFHYASFHSEIENFAFHISKPDTRYNRFLLARFDQNKTEDVISVIENTMEQIYPGETLNYSFLDEQINRQYQSEQLLMKLINVFSILAIIIASMGLMGLSIFMTEKRTKEIGIRKVNGSSVYEIVKMLSLVFIKWVVLAFVIATPITYYATHEWLQNFAYRTQLSWWIFVLAGIIALFIVLITVSWQTFKVARRNPVEALRYE